jgi:hypothetical protein
MLSCTSTTFYIQTGGTATEECNITAPCGSFAVGVALAGEYGDVAILGVAFEGISVTFPPNVDVGICSASSEPQVKANLTYASAGPTAPFFTIVNTKVRFANLTIILNVNNKGSFVSVEGLRFFWVLLCFILLWFFVLSWWFSIYLFLFSA